MKIILNVFINDLLRESYIIYYLCIYCNVFTIYLWNLSVHVFIKLIPLELIYFKGRACYIGK